MNYNSASPAQFVKAAPPRRRCSRWQCWGLTLNAIVACPGHALLRIAFILVGVHLLPPDQSAHAGGDHFFFVKAGAGAEHLFQTD